MDHALPADFREYWKRNYGPTIAVYRFNRDEPDRIDDLDRDFLAFLTVESGSRLGRSGSPGRVPTGHRN